MRATRLSLVAAFVLTGTTVHAAELKDGTYRVAGKDSGKGSYTGEVQLERKDATHARVRAVYVLAKGGKESFSTDATLEGDKLRFRFELKAQGFLAGFGSLL